MGFVIFGVTLGLLFGLGLFFLVLYPALRERRQQQLEDQSTENTEPVDEEQ